MTSDLKFKLMLSILLLAYGLLATASVRDMMGHYPLPKIVGMSGAPLSLSISPHAVATNPYQVQKFRVRIRIEPNPDNREYSYYATCGAEEKSSIRQIDFVTRTIFESLTVIADCHFQACLAQTGKKTPLCVKVTIPGG